MLRKILNWLPCWHQWDLVSDADLDDVRTCAKCGRQDILQVNGWVRLPPRRK
jgi:hypothetical protein